MIAVLILCIVTLVFVIVNTVLVATLHRLNIKVASKHVENKNAEQFAVAESAADEITDENSDKKE